MTIKPDTHSPTEVETWEDTIAMLRAGASPSEVLPNIRALLRGIPDPPAPEPPPAPSTPTSHLYHTINGKLFQIPYLRPPSHLWRLLNERGDDISTRLFDGELHVDVFELFKPRFIQPPDENVREELRNIECATGNIQIDVDEAPRKREWTDEDLKQFADRLEVLNSRKGSVIPSLEEEEWVRVVSASNFPMTLPFLSDAIRIINQPKFSCVVLASVLPLLAHNAEMEEFLEVVSTAVALGNLDEMPARKLAEILALYKSLGALGALAQVRMLCCD